MKPLLYGEAFDLSDSSRHVDTSASVVYTLRYGVNIIIIIIIIIIMQLTNEYPFYLNLNCLEAAYPASHCAFTSCLFTNYLFLYRFCFVVSCTLFLVIICIFISPETSKQSKQK